MAALFYPSSASACSPHRAGAFFALCGILLDVPKFKDSLRIKINPELAASLNDLLKHEPWRDRGDIVRQLLDEAIKRRPVTPAKTAKPVVPKSS